MSTTVIQSKSMAVYNLKHYITKTSQQLDTGVLQPPKYNKSPLYSAAGKTFICPVRHFTTIEFHEEEKSYPSYAAQTPVGFVNRVIHQFLDFWRYLLTLE